MQKTDIKNVFIIGGSILGLVAVFSLFDLFDKGPFSGIISEPIAEDLLLKTTKNKIIDAKYVDWFVAQPDNTVKNLGKIIRYDYISNVIIGQESYQGFSENIAKRTNNAQFFKKSEKLVKGKITEEWIGKFYPGTSFWKVGDDWFQVETATTTIIDFNKQTNPSVWERILGKKAIAATYYSGAGDGHVNVYSESMTSWNTAHNALTGEGADYTTASISAPRVLRTANIPDPLFGIWRLFVPIDTSALPDTATITAVSFNLYVSAKTNDMTSNDNINIIAPTTQADYTQLVVADYDTAGTTHSPNIIGTPINLGDITTGAYNIWNFNATSTQYASTTGYTRIAVREQHDYEDIQPPTDDQSNHLTVSLSETAGTAQDPYLTVTYDEEGGGAAAIIPEEEIIWIK